MDGFDHDSSMTNGLPTSLPAVLFVVITEAVHIYLKERDQYRSNLEVNKRKVMVCRPTQSHTTNEIDWIETTWETLCV